MDVTFTEREAIRKMLDYIEAERERLFNQSLNLLDRLRELDDIDDLTPGPSNLCTASFEENTETPAYDYSKVEEVTDSGIPIADFFPQEEEKDLIPKTEIEAQKDKDEKNSPVKKSKYRDVKVVAQYIKVILKDAGVPLKTSELIKRLKDTGIDASSPYVLLQQAAQYETRIERAKFGYYQYKW